MVSLVLRRITQVVLLLWPYAFLSSQPLTPLLISSNMEYRWRYSKRYKMADLKIKTIMVQFCKILYISFPVNESTESWYDPSPKNKPLNWLWNCYLRDHYYGWRGESDNTARETSRWVNHLVHSGSPKILPWKKPRRMRQHGCQSRVMSLPSAAEPRVRKLLRAADGQGLITWWQRFFLASQKRPGWAQNKLQSPAKTFDILQLLLICI